MLKVAVPLGVYVFNGDQAWTCQGGPTQTITDLIVKPTTRNVERRSGWASVGMRLWPGITENHPGFPAWKNAILRDPARPKLIVLECEASWKGVGHSYDLTWLDPDHDDLPVESISRSNFGQPDAAESTSHRICLDFARLPDGRWYPAHWQEARIAAPTTRPVRNESYGDYYRQVLPGAMLDDEWYGDPAARVKAAAGRLHPPPTAPTEAGR